MKKTIAAAIAAALTITLAGCANSGKGSEQSSNSQNTSDAAKTASQLTPEDLSIPSEDKDVGFEESESTRITLDGSSADISGSGASISGNTLSITEAGTYILSGSFDGQIYVKSKGSDIRLVLDGVSVTNSDHSALLIDKAAKVTLTLNDGSVNSFSDGASYTQTDDDDNADAAIFSRADLTINGEGSLNVGGNYKHGIVCKDELVITGGVINAVSVSSAIKGKDCVKISGGSITASAGTNGIVADNDEDETKGFIVLSGGSILIDSAGDGIQAETTLYIDGGEIDITTGGGSANASMKANGKPNGDWGNWDGFGGKGDRRGRGDMTPPDDGASFRNVAMTTSTATNSSASAKALKAGSAVEIAGGSITIDSSDDSLHSNGSMFISGGSITASSGDDGIHADSDLVIEGGSIDIQKSYEGIEGKNITITGGDISVTASDDGLNAAGGSDTGSTDRAGRNAFNTSDGGSYTLRIEGGNIHINANGDGLDSNGDLYMTGGTVLVEGPTSGGNGAIDYGDFNCTAQITGGSIIAVGAVGMEVGFDESSTQYSVLHNFGTTASAGSEFTVTDSAGKVILSFTPSKSYQSVVVSSPDLSEGDYTLTAGGQSEQISISSIVTSNSTGMGFGGGRGDFGGMQPPDRDPGGRGPW